MVLLCKGVYSEILDSVLNRVVAEEALELDSPSDSVTNSNSAQVINVRIISFFSLFYC